MGLSGGCASAKGCDACQRCRELVPNRTAERREIEIFNIQVAITDFSSSFDELEAEYARLQSEEDVAQQIGHILEKADNQIT